MTGPGSAKPGTQKTVKVKSVVKEYLDTILADVFPDISDEVEESLLDEPQTTEPKESPTNIDLQENNELQPSTDIEDSYLEEALLPVADVIDETPTTQITPGLPVNSPDIKEKTQFKVEVINEPQAEALEEAQGGITQTELAEPELEAELRYPQAPPWAQAGFDILLFNVCGLKLAVSMEALGRIIKVEHDTTQIIGKPDWFIGAYHESEQHLYVVDTAKFIMPEKGFDLAELGFDYIIQLQRSDWTLACKEVYKTIRINPDQVKWRSQKGKRQWLAGTVIEHMCALIHVDSLIDLLQKQAS